MSSAQKRRRPIAQIIAKREVRSTLGYMSNLHKNMQHDIVVDAVKQNNEKKK